MQKRNYILYYFMFILLILLFGCDYSNNNKDNKYNFYIKDNNAIILNSFNSSYSKGDKIVVQLKKIAGFESGLQINGKKASVKYDGFDILEVEFDMPEEDVTITSLINDDDSFSNSNLEGKHKISIGENSRKMNLGDGQFSYFNPGDTIKITFLRETIEEEIIILEDGEYLTRFDKRLSKDKKYMEISYIMPDKDVTISAVHIPTLQVFEAFPELESLYWSKTVNKIVIDFDNININKTIDIENEEDINRLNPHMIERFWLSPKNNSINANNTFSITYYTSEGNYTIDLFYDDSEISSYLLINNNYYYAGFDYSFIKSLIQ